MLSPQVSAAPSLLVSGAQDLTPSVLGEFVAFRDVYKSYGENLVVMDHMNLEMRADDRLVVIGPSGSGKSSLLR
ncbi:amino acid ABC transporter ATP-binding protein, partial [Trinickia sp. EG282A]